MKHKHDIWQDKPKLAALEVSEIEWKPSVHRLGDEILHIVGQGDDNESSEASSCDLDDDMGDMNQASFMSQIGLNQVSQITGGPEANNTTTHSIVQQDTM